MELHYKNRTIDNINGELWTDVINYDGSYSVSNYGRVKSEQRIVANGTTTGRLVKERILSQALCKDGRLKVSLSIHNKPEPADVSVIVWESFNGETPKDKIVLHKDKITLNNNLINLESGSITESHQINFTKGLLPHLKTNNEIRSLKVSLITEQICKKCKKLKLINQFEKNRHTCLQCRGRKYPIN